MRSTGAVVNGKVNFCNVTLIPKSVKRFAAFRLTSFPGTPAHPVSRQCKTTFCMHCIGTAEE